MPAQGEVCGALGTSDTEVLRQILVALGLASPRAGSAAQVCSQTHSVEPVLSEL